MILTITSWNSLTSRSDAQYTQVNNYFQEKVVNNNPTFTSGLPANSMVGMNENTSSVNGLNPRQMMVFNLIRSSTLEQGISKQDMFATLKDRMAQIEFE